LAFIFSVLNVLHYILKFEMGLVKGLRVCSASDKNLRKGIAADSLLNLKLKVAQKFNLNVSSSIRIFLAGNISNSFFENMQFSYIDHSLKNL
jgi:hypothetical protein